MSAPREIDTHIAIIDLNQPGVTIKTTGGNWDRPGEGGDTTHPQAAIGHHRPSDGRERAVGNNLAVIVNFAGRAAVSAGFAEFPPAELRYNGHSGDWRPGIPLPPGP